MIDTPGHDSYLMRLAHSMADTLITPLNDSFVDFDVLGTVDPATFAVTGTSHFAEMVREARRQRRVVDHATTDWIVVRNRLSMLGSRNKRLVGEGLQELSLRLGFRAVDGFAERVIFREFYPRGLTALDDLDEATLGTRPSLSHVTARQEVETLLDDAQAAVRRARPAARRGPRRNGSPPPASRSNCTTSCAESDGRCRGCRGPLRPAREVRTYRADSTVHGAMAKDRTPAPTDSRQAAGRELAARRDRRVSQAGALARPGRRRPASAAG